MSEAELREVVSFKFLFNTSPLYLKVSQVHKAFQRSTAKLIIDFLHKGLTLHDRVASNNFFGVEKKY